MKKIFVLLSLSVFAACAATLKFAPSADELPALQAKAPGITYDDAIQGYKLYTANCSNCHRLHNPKEYSIMQWNKILPVMFEKAKIMNNERQQLIKNFLIAKSK